MTTDNTTDANCETGTAYPSGAPEFIHVFSFVVQCCIHGCLSFCPFYFDHCIVLSFFDLRILITLVWHIQPFRTAIFKCSNFLCMLFRCMFRTEIKTMLHHFDLCLSVMLNNLSFNLISFLTKCSSTCDEQNNSSFVALK